MPLSFWKAGGLNKEAIWKSSGKRAQDPFSQETKERVDTLTRNCIMNNLRWLGAHDRDPAITSKGTDSDTDSERESDTDEDSEEETGRNNITDSNGEEVEKERGGAHKRKQTKNEEKRYNTSMRTATETPSQHYKNKQNGSKNTKQMIK